MSDTALAPSVMIGANPGQTVPQFGIFAKTCERGRTVGINLNDPQCISIFGQPGSGKSYTLGTLVEMASKEVDRINKLPAPLCSIIFHYSDSEFYPPEFVTMAKPNGNAEQVAELRANWQAEPTGIEDMVILTSPAMVAKRRREFPGYTVEAASFNPAELAGTHWKYLMGAVGSGSLYLRVLKSLIRDLAMQDDQAQYTMDAEGKKPERRLNIANIRAAINDSRLDEVDKRLAQIRLDIASRFIDETAPGIGSYVKPGRVIIIDARDEFIEKDEVFALLLVMLQVFSASTYLGKPVNKLIVFDEAHQYLSDADLIDGMISLIRVMRHKRTTICFASQDPISIPKRVIELSTILVLHKMISKEWLAHIASVNAALDEVRPSDIAYLGAGEALIWAQKASEDSFTKKVYKSKIRTSFTHQGGFTKSAVQ